MLRWSDQKSSKWNKMKHFSEWDKPKWRNSDKKAGASSSGDFPPPTTLEGGSIYTVLLIWLVIGGEPYLPNKSGEDDFKRRHDNAKKKCEENRSYLFQNPDEGYHHRCVLGGEQTESHPCARKTATDQIKTRHVQPINNPHMTANFQGL